MAKTEIPITGGFYVSDSLPISAQQCVNFYPNQPQTDSITQANLFNTEGIGMIADLINLKDVCRGLEVVAGVPFFVIGNTLYRLDRSFDIDNNEVFTGVDLGVVEGSEFVSTANNGDQLCIVALPDDDTTGKSYIYDIPTGLFSEITDPSFDGPADTVKYVGGLFVFSASSGSKFFNSPLKDGRGLPTGAAYDILDFSSAEDDPDDIRALGVSRSQLYVLGSITTQIFRNTGRSPAPFVGLQGATIDVGISARLSIQDASGGIVMVGSAFNETPAVWLLTGSNKQKLSTIAIDNELSNLTSDELERLSSWYYSERGHFFYGLTFPETTFVYDFTTRLWHERKSIKDTDLTKYRVSHMGSAYGRVLVGDNQDGRVGAVDRTLYTDYGFLQRRFITTKPFDNLGNPVFIPSIEAVIESGVGLPEDVQIQSGTTILGVPIDVRGGRDPQITLFWSDDGARTFIGGLSRSMGLIGEYKRRPIWRRLGRFPRSRVLRLEISSPTKATIIKLEADVNG